MKGIPDFVVLSVFKVLPVAGAKAGRNLSDNVCLMTFFLLVEVSYNRSLILWARSRYIGVRLIMPSVVRLEKFAIGHRYELSDRPAH